LEILSFLVSFGTLYSIYLILASSMELEYGELGLPSFAKAAFLALGAFTVGALSVRVGALILGLALEGEFKLTSYFYATLITRQIASHPLLGLVIFALPFAVAVPLAALLGAAVTYPALRLREDYLAITLIAFSEIVRVLARNYEPLVGGTFGAGVVNPFAWLGSPWRELVLFLVSLAMGFGIWLLTFKISTSPLGRILRAIRDDEIAAKAYGLDVAKVRAWVLAVGSAMAAVAGVLYAFYMGAVNPDDFTVSRTFIVVLMVVLGGRGNPYSPLVGAGIYLLIDRAMIFVKHLLPIPFDVNYASYVILGALLIVLLIKRPGGLVPERPLLTVKEIVNISERGDETLLFHKRE